MGLPLYHYICMRMHLSLLRGGDSLTNRDNDPGPYYPVALCPRAACGWMRWLPRQVATSLACTVIQAFRVVAAPLALGPGGGFQERFWGMYGQIKGTILSCATRSSEVMHIHVYIYIHTCMYIYTHININTNTNMILEMNIVVVIVEKMSWNIGISTKRNQY